MLGELLKAHEKKELEISEKIRQMIDEKKQK